MPDGSPVNFEGINNEGLFHRGYLNKRDEAFLVVAVGVMLYVDADYLSARKFHPGFLNQRDVVNHDLNEIDAIYIRT